MGRRVCGLRLHGVADGGVVGLGLKALPVPSAFLGSPRVSEPRPP